MREEREGGCETKGLYRASNPFRDEEEEEEIKIICMQERLKRQWGNEHRRVPFHCPPTPSQYVSFIAKKGLHSWVLGDVAQEVMMRIIKTMEEFTCHCVRAVGV